MSKDKEGSDSRKNVNVRIPDHVLTRIKTLAAREGRSQNEEIVWAIITYLNERGFHVDMENVYDLQDHTEESPADDVPF